MLVYLHFVYSFYCMTLSAGEDMRTIQFIGLISRSGGVWEGGEVTHEAMNMALEQVNARSDLLPNIKLNVSWEDTQCHAGMGVDRMFNQLYNKPTKIMIIGAGCSPVTVATALASHLWNVVQVSYVSASPALSDKTRFPLFFRLSAPRQQVASAIIHLMKTFNWKYIATIHEPEDLFSKVTEELTLKLLENNMTLVSSEIYTTDTSQQIASLKKKDARIILCEMYQDKAYSIFCEAYKQGLYGPKYVWIVTGFLEEEWWLQDRSHIDCSVEEMTMAIEGVFGTAPHYINSKQIKSIGGLTPNEFMEIFLRRMGDKSLYGLEFGPLAYDTIWATALALNETEHILKERGINKSISDFTYIDSDIAQIIKESFFKVEFQGLKGYVKFDKHGDSQAAIRIRRIQGGVRSIIGFYDLVTDSMQWLPENPLIWKGGKPPADSTTFVNRVVFVDVTTYISMCLLASLGLVLSIFFSAFNIIFRNERLIKMSSPWMNSAMVVGCMITYITVFLQERSEDMVVLLCKLRTAALMIGFSMAFGALFAKTWRVYAIFMNRTKRVVIRDQQLFLLLFAIVGIDVVILVGKELLDPQEATSYDAEVLESEDGDVVTVLKIWSCSSPYEVYFEGVIFSIKGLLLIFGAFLALQTRKVKIAALNDSQYIGVCIYNVALLSLLGVVLAFTLDDDVVLSYILTRSIIIFGTTSTQMIIFLPKIIGFKKPKNEVQDEMSITNTMSTAGGSTVDHENNNSQVARELTKTKQLLKEAEDRIRAKEKEIDVLKAQLNQYVGGS